METWKRISGYEGLYECSTHGRVRSVDRVVVCKNGMLKPVAGKILTPHFNTNGYLWVYLWKDGIKRFWLIHRLIAITFVANPQSKTFVNHKSGVKTVNLPGNLEWVTRQENVAHAFQTGLIDHAGEKNSQSRLTAETVALIRRECPQGTRITRAIVERYKDYIGKRRLADVINMRCWHGVKAA